MEPARPETAAAPDARPTNVRYLVLGFIAFASASAYLTRYAISVANTAMEQELSFGSTEMGNLRTAFWIGYGVFMVPVGWLGQRIGTRGVLAAISAMWSAFMCWTATVFSFVPLFTSYVAFGGAQAGLVPVSAQIVREWIPKKNHGFASAIISASMSTGSALSMGLTAWLIMYFHWRDIFRIYALVGIVWAVAFFIFFRSRPRNHASVNNAELALIDGAETAENEQPTQPPTETTEVTQYISSAPDVTTGEVLLGMLLSLSYWAISLQQIFRAAGYFLVATWMPAFLEKAHGIKAETGGMLSIGPQVAVIFGSLLGGALVDILLARTGSRRVSRSAFTVTMMFSAAAIIYAATWSESPYVLMAVITASSLLSGTGNPATWAATIDMSGKHTAIGFGVMNATGVLGNMLIAEVIGRLMDHIKETNGNWNLIIYILAGNYLAAGCCWIFINSNRDVTRRWREFKERWQSE